MGQERRDYSIVFQVLLDLEAFDILKQLIDVIEKRSRVLDANSK